MPNDVKRFGSISSNAIIIAWVLTAFLPLPLMISIVTLRYFPNALSRLLFRYPLRTKRYGNRQSGSSLTTGHSVSTPSSRTFTVSNTSSQTLPVLGHRPASPLQGGSGNGDSLSPRTPRNSLATRVGSPRTPPKSNPTPQSTGTTKEDSPGNDHALSRLPSAFESPKRLSFLEPSSLSSSPRKKAYVRLSPGKPRNKTVIDSPVTSHAVQRRRLKRRFLISAILLGLIFAMYVLEGFTIAAAQGYAHARVLSQANGKGGLGNGKEDERWLIPWVIYVFLQGGLVLGCAWMVWGMKQEVKLLDQKWRSEKGKGVKKSDDVVAQNTDLQTTMTEGETEHFLPKTEDVFEEGREGHGQTEDDETKEGEEEEPEWQSLGYHPTFDSLDTPTTLTDLPNTKATSSSSQDLHTATSNPNPLGEGSSQGSYYSVGYNPSTTPPASSFPISFLPDKVGSWWAERSHAETELQRQDSRSKRWGWESENDEPTKEDRIALLREELLGKACDTERRNSWAQDAEEEIEREEETGKGKEKEQDKAEEVELTTHVPRELLTGINL
ncbi:MAG: hypothetical protein Q9225_007159, partial [Loekoesia sp. 1 TL-2023]